MFTPGGQIDRLTFAGVYGGGGKGGGYVPPPLPPTFTDPITGKVYDTPAALNTAVDARTPAPVHVETPEEKTAREATELSDWTNKTKNPAIATERNLIGDAFRKAGIADPEKDYGADIDLGLQPYLNQIKDKDPDVAKLFPTDLGTTILNNVQGGARTAATSKFNNVFTPTYVSDKLTDATLGLDPATTTLLNEQLNPLADQLISANKRGTLTDFGYKTASDLLNTKRASGTDTLHTLGHSILNTDRTDLNDYITHSRGDVADMKLPDAAKFDVAPYQTESERMIAGDIGDFGGALRNALGDTKFTDFTSLLNAGGTAQGATNPSAINPTGDQGLGSIILDQSKRGIGSTGAF